MYRAVRYSAPMCTLVWFRQDLRVADNPALDAAVRAGGAVVPLYVYAPQEEGAWPPGAASRYWLHGSLMQLQQDLRALGARLIVRHAEDTLAELKAVASACGATRVLWNRRYEPSAIARDRRIKSALQAAGLEVASYNGALLREPWEVANKAGAAFQVFTPFWRHCLKLADPAEPVPAPQRLAAPERWPESQRLEELALLPRIDWAAGIRAAWTPGSAAGLEHLEQFLNDAFDQYPNARDRPDVAGTSHLSPYLHFGEISPRQIWHRLRRFAQARGQHTTWRQSQFLTEVGWREFAHHLLYHFPQTPEHPLRANFARFPWNSDPSAARAWQLGKTGYPIVDAGMRQLWHTGWMHNRVRMIVGSFLVKDLLLPWSAGAAWFWDTLVDADLASNTLGWQWVAGCGADAAPYFRIFNPITQATRFDPEGTYIRKWVPELADLPGRWIHEPWAAPPEALGAAGVRLGIDYPHRLVDHGVAHERALEALATLR
jgi:deoxyribodipyrimidine photo-lyase